MLLNVSLVYCRVVTRRPAPLLSAASPPTHQGFRAQTPKCNLQPIFQSSLFHRVLLFHLSLIRLYTLYTEQPEIAFYHGGSVCVCGDLSYIYGKCEGYDLNRNLLNGKHIVCTIETLNEGNVTMLFGEKLHTCMNTSRLPRVTADPTNITYSVLCVNMYAFSRRSCVLLCLQVIV